MIKWSVSLFLLVCNLSAMAQKQVDAIDIEAGKYGFLQEEAMLANDNGSNIDEKYVRFNLTMNPATSPAYISGSVTHYFTTKVANVQTIKYDLYNVGMNVTSLVYHGTTYTSTTRIDHIVDTVVINLPVAIPAVGTLDSVTIFYNGNPPQSTNSRGYKRNTTMDATANLSTHSSGYFARQWWPCKHVLGDKIDSVDIIVTAPSANLVAANGILKTTAPPIVGGNKTWWWKTTYPVAHYLIAIAVYPYTVYNSPAAVIGGTNVPIANYLTPSTNTATVRSALDHMKPVMEHFSTLFGEYPFKNEKYGHVAYTFGGGMENQTVSFIGTGSLSNRSLLAHELAHQWWGDMVTCATWGHIWVNEGFARYSEILYAEQFNPANVVSTRNSYKNGAGVKSTTGTVYRYDTEVVVEADHTGKIFNSAMVYNKAAIVIHMLRRMVGDANFFLALRNYLSDPLLNHGYAATEDVRRHFEAVSGQDLTSFFDDFIYQSGWGIYTVNWGSRTSAAPYVTVINYSQAKSAGSIVSYYNTVLPVRLRNTTLARDTMVYIADDPALPGNDISFVTSFPVTSIEVDPFHEAYTYDPVVNAATITVLPIRLLAFTGQRKENNILLNWQVDELGGFSHFELQKSIDGQNFSSIANIGSHLGQKEYEYIDTELVPGNNYYRLKLVDEDGSVRYSQIVMVVVPGQGRIKVGPNPASSKLQIFNPGPALKDAYAVLVNTAGQKLFPSVLTADEFQIQLDVSLIPSGVYWLELNGRKGGKYVERIIIRH
jgi:hypothetical protein